MELNIELAAEAKQNGICSPWYQRLLATQDKEALIRMYLAGLDFCLTHNYPSNEYIKANFAGSEAFGIYVDALINAQNSKHVVALGTCQGLAAYTGFSVGEVYVKHAGKVRITATDNAFVMVDVYDSAEVEVEASGNAKVCVHHFGGSISKTAIDSAVVKVIVKQTKN